MDEQDVRSDHYQGGQGSSWVEISSGGRDGGMGGRKSNMVVVSQSARDEEFA